MALVQDGGALVGRRVEDGTYVVVGYAGGLAQERGVGGPFVPGAVEDGDAGDGEFEDGGGERSARADGA